MSNFPDQFSSPPLQPPAARSRTPLWKTLLLVFGLLTLGMLVLCGGLGVFLYNYNLREIEQPVTAADRELVIKAEQIAEYAPKAKVDPSRATLRKVSHPDGSLELEYEYTTEDGVTPVLYVSYMAGVETNTDSAKWAYKGMGWGLNYGLNELKQIERNDLWQYGDESRCIILEGEQGKVGTVISARNGRRLFMLTIVGVYFEDAEAIKEVVGPMLQQLENYEGK